jgi:hypothetical protein
MKTKRSVIWQIFFGVIATILMINMSSCVTPYQNPNLPTLIPESEYNSLTEKYTANKKVYDGFIQTMEVSATLLNTPVSRAQLDHKARIFQWSPEQYKSHQAELESSLSKETKVFFDFFVPERKHDDLHKPKTLWRVFLDAGGKRYEAKVERLKTILADVQSLYPTHNRFFTPYVMTFPVPVSSIENAESSLTITGPVGTTKVEFKSLQ